MLCWLSQPSRQPLQQPDHLRLPSIHLPLLWVLRCHLPQHLCHRCHRLKLLCLRHRRWGLLVTTVTHVVMVGSLRRTHTGAHSSGSLLTHRAGLGYIISPGLLPRPAHNNQQLLLHLDLKDSVLSPNPQCKKKKIKKNDAIKSVKQIRLISLITVPLWANPSAANRGQITFW